MSVIADQNNNAQCGCLCHSSGCMFYNATNPPQPCCVCYSSNLMQILPKDEIERILKSYPPTMNEWEKPFNIKEEMTAQMADHQRLQDRVKKLEDSDHDERIHDLENIQAETRLLRLEKILNSPSPNMDIIGIKQRLGALEQKIFEQEIENIDEVTNTDCFKCAKCNNQVAMITYSKNIMYKPYFVLCSPCYYLLCENAGADK